MYSCLTSPFASSPPLFLSSLPSSPPSPSSPFLLPHSTEEVKQNVNKAVHEIVDPIRSKVCTLSLLPPHPLPSLLSLLLSFSSSSLYFHLPHSPSPSLSSPTTHLCATVPPNMPIHVHTYTVIKIVGLIKIIYLLFARVSCFVWPASLFSLLHTLASPIPDYSFTIHSHMTSHDVT